MNALYNIYEKKLKKLMKLEKFVAKLKKRPNKLLFKFNTSNGPEIFLLNAGSVNNNI